MARFHQNGNAVRLRTKKLIYFKDFAAKFPPGVAANLSHIHRLRKGF